MNHNSFYIIITGASRGIGLELTKQYVFNGVSGGQSCRVIAACRDPENAQQLQALAHEVSRKGQNNLVIRELDVTNQDSVQAFVSTLRDRPIDVLINNAGMFGPNAPLLDVDIDKWHEVFHINCMAPVYLSQQLFENVRQSQIGKIVTISSDMGSIGLNEGGGAYLYRSSKSALNSAMYSLSLDVKSMGVTVMMLHPGHVITDMGGPNAKVPVQESVEGLRRVIDDTNLDETGAFKNWLGESLPW
ncbi:SDR family oxidoreductase [Alteromonas sp. a30]|uniref:SDR family oxidoreductase n=1 Tax=Alteromonas sp. a30 TaxID=2730917 RepID=UPI002281C2B5|nr:SDR family oxidoreductase [Alteromonas sp. a30]MCY7296205.1 SDR family oxidoreductase [Alteromonas sp. a30]